MSALDAGVCVRVVDGGPDLGILPAGKRGSIQSRLYSCV